MVNIKMMMDEITKVIMCPLIGYKMRIMNSSSRKLVGTKGKVIDETKNMIIFESKIKGTTKKAIKKIMKKGNIFEVKSNGKKIIITGDKIMFRPEEKAKKIKLEIINR